ncbi:MAG: tetratricopeptide repeat protein [Bacteroidales bacterium]|nr:tetratricopeptide repeat protein [Bacteroidales bacterium]
MKRLYLIIFMLSMVASGASAQVDRQDVRRGNRDFRKENYREAEIDYRKALVKDSLSLAANYNLANALYREGDMANAAKALEQIKEVAPSSASASDYYYNVGDVAIAQQNWQGAVDAFRQSLILNPDDLDAKENYIYAKKKLEEQQNQDNQDQDNKNDQNQDDQDQDQNNDQNQDDQNQNDQNQDQKNENQDQKNQPQQGQEPKITPQAAQQMLKAIQAKEKETQDKVNRQKAEALKSRQKEKNW